MDFDVKLTVKQTYKAMTVSERAEMRELLGCRFPNQSFMIDTWYAEANEGQRTHMANKLIKHGYPATGKHSVAQRESMGFARGYDAGCKDTKHANDCEAYEEGYEAGRVVQRVINECGYDNDL